MKKDPTKIKNLLRARRRQRIRQRVRGNAERPRLSVFRSSRYMLLQLIDDEKGITIVSATDRPAGGGKKRPAKKNLAKKEAAFAVGKELAQRAQAKGIQSVVLDRGGNAYHGRVKEAAEGARKGGLQF